MTSILEQFESSFIWVYLFVLLWWGIAINGKLYMRMPISLVDWLILGAGLTFVYYIDKRGLVVLDKGG